MRPTWALELLGCPEGVDAARFHEGVDRSLTAALAEQNATVQVVRLDRPAAIAELLLHGWCEAAATALHDSAAAGCPGSGIALLEGSTQLPDKLSVRAVEWIPVEIVPALGVISRRAGRLEGQNALLDQRVVGLRVRGHWSDLHRAERLLIRGEVMPNWMRVLFRRSGEFQLQQELPRAPADLVCRCARVRCDQVAELIRQQPSLTVEALARQTKATSVCGGCIPMFESWLAVGGSMPPGGSADVG